MRPCFQVFCFLLLVMGGKGFAALSWERVAAEGRNAVELFEFSFENRGSEDVRITGVEWSCDCISAEADRRVVRPGERGVLRVKLDAEGLRGTVRRLVYVKTSGRDGERTQELSVAVELPELITISPRAVFWNRNEELSERLVEVFVDDALMEGCKVEAVLSNSDVFAGRLEKGERPGVYRVWIRPTKTDEPKMSLLLLKLNREAPKGVNTAILARIR